MKNKRITAFFCVFLSAFMCLSAEGKIFGFKINGLKKTKVSYVESVLEKFLGKDYSVLNLSEVETELRSQDLFSEIGIKVLKEDGNEANETDNDGNLTLEVNLKEKITFIPLPFAMYSSDGFMGGFMLMNMNLFGTKNQLVTGGIFTQSSQRGIVVFNHPAKSLEKPGLSVFCSGAHDETSVTAFDNCKLFDYEYAGADAKVSGIFKINDRLAFTTGGSWCFKYGMEDDLSDVNQWLVSSGLNFSHSRWNGWFMMNTSAMINGSCGYSTEDKIIYEANGFFRHEFELNPRLRLMTGISGSIEAGKNIMLVQNRGSIGSTIMSSAFKSEKMFGAGMNLEGAIVKLPFGTLTLYGTYEFDGAEDYDDSFVYCHGPGCGMKMYFKQLAFPAFAGGATYNVTENLWQYSIAAGLSM